MLALHLALLTQGLLRTLPSLVSQVRLFQSHPLRVSPSLHRLWLFQVQAYHPLSLYQELFSPLDLKFTQLAHPLLLYQELSLPLDLQSTQVAHLTVPPVIMLVEPASTSPLNQPPLPLSLASPPPVDPQLHPQAWLSLVLLAVLASPWDWLLSLWVLLLFCRLGDEEKSGCIWVVWTELEDFLCLNEVLIPLSIVYSILM